jgi:FdhD protein
MASLKTSRKINCWELTGKQLTPTKSDIIIEQELPIYVNGKQLITASVTPTLEKEFALGYLLGQGLIKSSDGVESVDILNNTVHVTLKDKRKTFALDASLPEIKSNITVRKRVIFSAMNQLFRNAELNEITDGAHAAGLFNTRASALCIIEDIGRHNTLDKIIGYAVRHKVDLNKSILVSTGRMASEMVIKICHCGIPIAATTAAVTDKGLEIAKKCGLTIIGFVRDKGTKINTDMDVRVTKAANMKIYAGAARIICE